MSSTGTSGNRFADLLITGFNAINGSGDVLSNIFDYNDSLPRIDILESEQYIIVLVEVPGVKPENIDLDFYNNRLSISGIRENVGENFTKIQQEISYRRFSRVVNLPLSVTNQNNVETKLENGILKISIDKSQEERNRFSVSIQNDD